MTKAKPIDRLELTRRKMEARKAQIQGHGLMAEVTKDNVKAWQDYFSDTPAYPGAEETMEQVLHGDLCPVCGRNTLIHESGCVKCFACNWSKCG